MHIILENKIVLVTIILLIVATLISFTRKSGQRQFRRYAFLIIMIVICLYKMNFSKDAVDVSAETEEDEIVEEEEELSFYIDVNNGEDGYGAYLNDYLNDSEESCQASSRLRADKDWYIPYRVVDGSIDTCWQEGVDGFGEEEYVEFYFDEPVILGHFTIQNGKAKSQEDYEKNGRICEIEYTDSESRTQTFTLSDVLDPQYFYISTPTEISWVRFTIKSVYDENAAYQDTCLTEISFYE